MTTADERIGRPGGDGVGPRRRAVLRAALAAGAGLAATSALGRGDSAASGRPAADPAPEAPAWGDAFSAGWLFGGEYVPGAEKADYNDWAFMPVTLPHSVCELSWGGWDPGQWEKVWIYRRHFTSPLDQPGRTGWRVFADFEGVMVNAVAVLNGRTAGSHQGGYLPWSVELTPHLVPGPNVLAVVVDARCLPVPPIAPGQGPTASTSCSRGGSTGRPPCEWCHPPTWPTCSRGPPTCSPGRLRWRCSARWTPGCPPAERRRR